MPRISIRFQNYVFRILLLPWVWVTSSYCTYIYVRLVKISVYLHAAIAVPQKYPSCVFFPENIHYQYYWNNMEFGTILVFHCFTCSLNVSWNRQCSITTCFLSGNFLSKTLKQTKQLSLEKLKNHVKWQLC